MAPGPESPGAPTPPLPAGLPPPWPASLQALHSSQTHLRGTGQPSALATAVGVKLIPEISSRLGQEKRLSHEKTLIENVVSCGLVRLLQLRPPTVSSVSPKSPVYCEPVMPQMEIWPQLGSKRGAQLAGGVPWNQ